MPLLATAGLEENSWQEAVMTLRQLFGRGSNAKELPNREGRTTSMPRHVAQCPMP